jgi:hypothetical protein
MRQKVKVSSLDTKYGKSLSFSPCRIQSCLSESEGRRQRMTDGGARGGAGGGGDVAVALDGRLASGGGGGAQNSS